MAGAPDTLASLFAERFGAAPDALYRAPGRINLIGDHTDYSGGLVLPMAIGQACWVAARKNGAGLLRVHTADLSQDFEIAADSSLASSASPAGDWSDYVTGVAVELARAGYSVAPMDLCIQSTVPMGAGLSSSAAIEVACALALLDGRPMEGVALALLCQRAENHFAGTPCGIMDQFVSVHGRAGCAICIDCRSLGYEAVQLPPDISVVAVNSMAKRALGASEYPKRRRQCEESAARLGLTTLRDATLESIASLDTDLLPRARHVISENARVRRFLSASAASDPAAMGRELLESHRSLRDDYEVSCPELDFLVEAAMRIPGVYGARMTGGGFGGCTVNLVDRSAVEDFETGIREAYRSSSFGIDPQVIECAAAAGAGRG